MRSKASALLALFAVAAIGASPVVAANPHLVRADGTYSQASRQIQVNVKVAGLGKAKGETISVTGTYTLYYQCIKKHGNTPSGAQGIPYQTERAIAINATFNADHNGMVEKTITQSVNPGICPRGGWTYDYDHDSVELHASIAAEAMFHETLAVTWY